MGFQKPIAAPVSRSGYAKFASKSAGMHPGLNSMPSVGAGASQRGGSPLTPPSLQKKKPGSKRSYPLNMKAKSPVYKAHKPASNPNGVLNTNTGKPDISGNPSRPKNLVLGTAKGSAFYGQ
jgi:hypothetical protein